jgi:hypothetical protein
MSRCQMIQSDEDTQVIISLLLFFSGVAVLGWQVYEYLRYSIWTAISVVTFFEWAGVPWASYPTDWIGLHSILKFVPLSLTLMASSVLVVMY